jgi:site-specific recombinase XerD
VPYANNYSENTLRAYLNGLNIFLDYVKANQITSITPKVLGTYFHFRKKNWITATP